MGQVPHRHWPSDAEQDTALPKGGPDDEEDGSPVDPVDEAWMEESWGGALGSGGCTFSCADSTWDIQWRLVGGDTVISDKGNVSPNLLTIAWPNDFLIVFILNNNFERFGCFNQPVH